MSIEKMNFKRWVHKVLPAVYDESLSYYELLCKVIAKLNETIDLSNNTAEGLQELKNYVDTYFDNLDIQAEVDAKLDEMAQPGELAELISQYLEAQAVIGFNTNSSLAGATNLADGSFARTYGKNTYNDGKGAFYKIRERLNVDVPDGDNIIVLTETDNLVAEKMPDFRMNQAETNISSLQTQVSGITNKKWMFVGDSYSEGYTPGGTVTGWSYLLKDLLGLTNETCIILDQGGAGFNSPAYKYKNMIESELEDDDEITDILFAGGYNDRAQGRNALITAINDTANICHTKFPNAKIHCAFIGGTTLDDHGKLYLTKTYYSEGCLYSHINFLPNLEYILYGEEYLSSDKIHPNQSGQNMIAWALYQSLTGKEYTYCRYAEITVEPDANSSFPGDNLIFKLNSHNNITTFGYPGTSNVYRTASASFTFPNDRILTLGKLKYKNGIVGSEYWDNNYMSGLLKIAIHSTTSGVGWRDATAQLIIDKDGYVKIKVQTIINDTHDNFLNLGNINQIMFMPFSVTVNTDLI